MGLTHGHHRIENCSFEYCLRPLRFRQQDSNGAKVFFLGREKSPSWYSAVSLWGCLVPRHERILAILITWREWEMRGAWYSVSLFTSLIMLYFLLCWMEWFYYGWSFSLFAAVYFKDSCWSAIYRTFLDYNWLSKTVSGMLNGPTQISQSEEMNFGLESSLNMCHSASKGKRLSAVRVSVGVSVDFKLDAQPI